MGLKIKPSSVIALDTNIFIYAFEKETQHGQESRLLFENIKKSAPKVYISVLVFEEFLVKVYKENLESELGMYEDFITAGGLITVVDFDREIARKAAYLRARYSLKAPDAIHIASAICSGAGVFVSADRKLPRSIEGLSIKILDQIV